MMQREEETDEVWELLFADYLATGRNTREFAERILGIGKKLERGELRVNTRRTEMMMNRRAGYKTSTHSHTVAQARCSVVCSDILEGRRRRLFDRW